MARFASVIVGSLFCFFSAVACEEKGPGHGSALVSDGGGSGGESSPTGDGGRGSGSVSCNVRALFESKCGSCHGLENTFAELDLVASGLDERLMDMPSLSCPDWSLVVPGSPERSNLYQKVASDTPPCGDRMPPQEPLSDVEIDCVGDYIVSLGGPDAIEPCETCGGTTCVNFDSDAAHCGACDSPCGEGEVCKLEQCEGCPEGFVSCGGECVSLENSTEHCGACNAACGGGQSCLAGRCECDVETKNVSFAADVEPLLMASCATNGCHAERGGGRPGGPSGETGELVFGATGAYAALVGRDAGCDGKSFVEPGDVSASYLMNKLTGINMCGGTRMPKGGAPFSQQQLDVIGAWICSGAANN